VNLLWYLYGILPVTMNITDIRDSMIMHVKQDLPKFAKFINNVIYSDANINMNEYFDDEKFTDDFISIFIQAIKEFDVTDKQNIEDITIKNILDFIFIEIHNYTYGKTMNLMVNLPIVTYTVDSDMFQEYVWLMSYGFRPFFDDM